MNPILELIAASVRFTLKHAWPILAAAAALVALQFGLDLALKPLEPELKNPTAAAAAIVMAIALLHALILTFYTAIVYTLIYNRLGAAAAGYRTFRDRLKGPFANLFLYSFIIALFGVLFLPFLVFLPYVEVLILFENQSLTKAVRRNFTLLMELPWPALFVAGAAVIIAGLIPILLLAGEAPLTARSLYGYGAVILTLPLNVAVIALYLNLSLGRAPAGFPDFPLGEDI